MANTGNDAAIARPYARAVFELAKAGGQLGQWSEVLHAAAAVISDPQVARLIGAPATDKQKLVGLVVDVASKAADADATKVNNLIRLLAENSRLSALPEIAQAFDALKADVENRVEVTLRAAAPLDESQQTKIVEALKKRFGRDVSLSVELDENLIGGATLRADDLVIDGSVSAGLAKLATVLAN